MERRAEPETWIQPALGRPVGPEPRSARRGSTRPDARPASSRHGGISSKSTVTDRFDVIDTLHVEPVPEQAPLHLFTRHPLAGTAVSVTDVPDSYPSLQSLPHAIPAGLDVTDPGPTGETDSV
jgi:hypothetical protein